MSDLDHQSVEMEEMGKSSVHRPVYPKSFVFLKKEAGNN